MSQASESSETPELLDEREDEEIDVADLQEQLKSVQQRQSDILDRLDAAKEEREDLAASETVTMLVNHVITALTGASLDYTDDPLSHKSLLADFRERINTELAGLATDVDRIDQDLDNARKSIANSGNETVEKVCRRALKDARDQKYLVMRPDKIAAAADVSTRHGYNLVEGLPEKYPSLFKHNSDIQRDIAGNGRAEKAVAVKIEPLQRNADQLNRFINTLDETGES